VWPEPVERIAAFLRDAGAQGRIEELPPGVDEPPGTAVRAAGFDCDGRTLVVIVPVERAVDRDKVRRAVGCTDLRPAPFPAFPYRPARVLVERSILSVRTAWLEAGSPRHVLGISPSQLVSLASAETADLLVDD
jgi:prolyl-tRNA editing enzyme YbaK/EbsC (Cys-tRNA(Pro) deacylase)